METDSVLRVGTVVHNCFIRHGFSTAVVLLKILFLLRYYDLSVMQRNDSLLRFTKFKMTPLPKDTRLSCSCANIIMHDTFLLAWRQKLKNVT